MSKTKKIIISILVILLLASAGYCIYTKYIYNPYSAEEKQGLNNFSGVVKAIEGNNIRVLAQIPEEFTPFSKGGYDYIEKEYLLKSSDSSVILLQTDIDVFNELETLSEAKIGDYFSAMATENIMDKNEIVVSEIILFR
ncbi:hypothetical protein KJ671_04175 [Patescibacteria group bacterium]|nr:hypothetical protein [Patescibacteria group bacterium]